MHRYLKCIGFQSITTRKQLKEVFDLVLKDPDTVQTIPTEEEDGQLSVLTKEFIPNMGLTLCGTYDEAGNFELEFYFPYLYSQLFSSPASITFERQGEKNAYMGSCDDYQVGITLIFHLSNFVQLCQLTQKNGTAPETFGVYLSGLADEGKILLPIHKTIDQQTEWNMDAKKHNMVEAAKEGDRAAIEYLTQREMRTFARVNRELPTTDIYTLISSFVMPRGNECDQYTILGEIIDAYSFINHTTEETVYLILLKCNHMHLSIGINQADLVGIPEKGRRFKGNIWLQGAARFGSIDSSPYL